MVFSLGCLKKSLLALVAVSLLVAIGQLVLIFINNKIFGALMFVLYILFFLAILLALCRDSVSMYAAAAVLLIVFVIGCTLIQAYDVEVKDLLDLSAAEESDASTPKPTGGKKNKRSEFMYQILQSDDQWKPQEPVTWEPADDRLPIYPVNPQQPLPADLQPDPRSDQQPFEYQTAPSLPPQPTMPTLTVPEVPTAPDPGPRSADYDETFRAAKDDKDKPEKKYRWRNELRWVSNVLGVLHILILAVVICILYEMLFGGRYRYRTWC